MWFCSVKKTGRCDKGQELCLCSDQRLGDFIGRKGGIMEPSSSGQSFAIGRAYKTLDYKIADVDFVEGHGTGTTKGDRVELEGIATAIEQTVSKENKNTRKCGVTSFKSIVGHTKAAAGVGGLIKAILAVNQRILPPTASCTNPNEVFKDKARNLYPLIQGGLLPPEKMPGQAYHRRALAESIVMSPLNPKMSRKKIKAQDR